MTRHPIDPSEHASSERERNVKGPQPQDAGFHGAEEYALGTESNATENEEETPESPIRDALGPDAGDLGLNVVGLSDIGVAVGPDRYLTE